MNKLINLLALLVLTANAYAYYDDDPEPIEYDVKVDAVVCGHFGAVTGEACGVFVEYHDNGFKVAVMFTHPKAMEQLAKLGPALEGKWIGSYGNCGKKIKTGAQIGELKSFDSSYFYKTSDVKSFDWDCFFYTPFMLQ